MRHHWNWLVNDSELRRIKSLAASQRFWLWVSALGFAAVEWYIIFHSDFRHSFHLLRQGPETASNASAAVTSDQKNAALQFLALKTWAVFLLAEAFLCGAVTWMSIRSIMDLWHTGDSAGRARRIRRIATRLLLLGIILWFVTLRESSWFMGSYAGRLTLYGSGVMPFVAVGCAVTAMMVIELRVSSLGVAMIRQDIIVDYLGLRRKLQIFLSVSSAVLACGVVSMFLRRLFVSSLCTCNLFPPQKIILESLEFTILLGVAYGPIHATFNSVGMRICDLALSRNTLHNAAGIQEWARQANDIEELLQLKLHDWKALGPGFAVIAPVVVGIIGHHL